MLLCNFATLQICNMTSETKQPSIQTAVPISSRERIHFVDILRGFALLGVFLFNIYGFGGDNFNMTAWSGWLNRGLVLLRDFLIQAKFYSLFSFLFGWGMSIHLLRAQARGSKFLPIYLRRITLLLLIGLAHGIFIWDGDILTVYALLGFILLLFRKRSERFLLISAILLLAFSIFMTLPYNWVETIRVWYRARTAVFHWTNQGQTFYGTGTYAQIMSDRAQSFIGRNADGLIFFLGNVLSMFLLGLYVGKRQIFQHIDDHLPLLRRVMWSGLVIGVLFNGLFVLNTYWTQTTRPGWYPVNFAWTIHTGTRTIGAPALMLFYVTTLILLLQQEKWQKRLAPLGPVGRMALSNYLTQSTLGTLIFYGYGLGLYGRTGPIFYLILVGLIFLAQIRFSAWWLERYQFGPAEWAWRSLTYGRRQPLRRGETLEEVRPFSWLQRLGLIVVVVGLIGGYSWRNLRPDETSADILPLIANNVEAQVTPTPIVPALAAAPTVAPTPQPTIVPPAVQPVAYQPGSIVANGDWGALAASFDVEMALATIEELSGTSYIGRSAGTPGGAAAANYIANQFAQLGLQPAGTGDSSGVAAYFQPFTIHQTQLDGRPRLIVETADGTLIDNYTLHQDFAPAVRVYMGAGTAEGDVVWANNCARDDFAGLDAVGKVVMCRGDWPRTDVGLVLEHGAAALLLLAGPDSYALDFTPVYYEAWIPDALTIPTFRISSDVAADLMAGSGQTVADLTINFTSFPLDSRVHLEIATTDCTDCIAQNVLGVLPGHNPDTADEIVIISAHYDHLGQSPDGTIWPGANDNASGIAAMLEIARSWQEAGFVPQRTVLFAAWDAEEIGLLGSRHYVQNPRYPLDKTVAIINLDMVGGGEETLYLSGTGLESQVLAVSATMGISATVRDSGRSDHFPFQQASITAGTLGWFNGGDDPPTYHRPIDTPDVIETDKLAILGQIAGLTALNLTDAKPQLDDLLAQRAAAIAENDLAAFLETSQPAQRNGDRVWFADVAALTPISATMTADHVRLLGDTAVAATQLNLIYLETRDETPITRTLSVPLPARFVSGAGGWQWAGADLVTAKRGAADTFTISYPADVAAEAITGAAQFVTQQYSTTATLLGLPADPNARLIFYPNANALRADTALSLPDGTNAWVGPGLVKLVYSGPITSHQQLTTSLSQLVLAEAGVTKTAVPWLWRGLADVIAAESDLETVQRGHVSVLTAAFAEETLVRSAATDWAAVDYLRRQLGWDGLGQFILDAGQNGLESALQSTLSMNSAQLETAWRQDWKNRLAAAETAVDRLLSTRTDAVFAKNRATFLGTVDPSPPLVYAEERAWFDDLGEKPPISFSLTGKLLALYEDGRILATITQVYEPDSGRGGTTQRDILFVPDENGLRWAGTPSETLIGDFVTVLYPPGQLDKAQQFLARADDLIPQLPAYLTTDLSDHRTIRLPDYPTTRLLTQRQLAQLGVTDAWLLEGTAVYLAAQFDDQIEQAAAANFHDLWIAVDNNRIGGVADIPDRLTNGSDKAQELATTQAWDMIRYLTLTYGEEALETLLRAHAGGQSIEEALQTAVNQSVAEFDAAWAESLRQNHAPAAWIEIANGFDVAQATQHIAVLAAPELAGRQAGSPGAETAAAYIADQFAAYGLEPVPIGMTVITSTESVTETAVFIPELSYFQPFTIEFATLTAVPRLELGTETLDYRRHFMTLLSEIPGGGLAEGQLVFVRDGTYTGMDLSGKIVIRIPETAVFDEMTAAMEHGAAGLILVGESDYEKDFQMKRPFPATYPDETTIPTLLLTQIGLERLLEITGLTRADLNTLPTALPLDLQVQMDVPLSQPEVVETANVLGYLPGSDPDLRSETIIIGAHYDHVGDDPGERPYSGANDNASGVAVLLEIARLWQETGYRPGRSVLFAAWGAQEPGEIGSSYYISHPVMSLTNTTNVIVLDSVGGGAGHRLMAQGNWERDGLMLFGAEQADGVLDGRLRTNIPANQSDDTPFREAGLPTMLLTWTDASEENWPDALADEIDPDDLAASGRMATLAIMMTAR